jgi:DNA polymerase III delta prime subunit
MRSKDAKPKDAETFDGEQFVKSVRREHNRNQRGGAKTADGSGSFRFIEQPEVDWARYIYDKASPWGRNVYAVELRIRRAKRFQEAVKANKQELRKKQTELRSLNRPAANATAPEKEAHKNRLLELQKSVQESLDVIVHSQKNAQAALSVIPRFLVLYGEPGVGKTVYAHAFSDLGRFEFTQLQLETASGPLVSQHETMTRDALQNILNMSDTVVLMDEFDGATGGGAGSENDPNQHHRSRMSLILDFFGSEETRRKMRERNVYVIATTNNPERVRGALMDRAKMYEVPPPMSSEEVEKQLRNAVENLEKNKGDTLGTFKSIVDTKGLCQAVKAIWEKIDWKPIAEVMFASGINFRKLGEWCDSAIQAGADYLQWQDKLNLYRKAKTDPAAAHSYELQYGSECTFDAATGKLAVDPEFDPEKNSYGIPLDNQHLLWAARRTKVEFQTSGAGRNRYCMVKQDGIQDMELGMASNPNLVSQDPDKVNIEDYLPMEFGKKKPEKTEKPMEFDFYGTPAMKEEQKPGGPKPEDEALK